MTKKSEKKRFSRAAGRVWTSALAKEVTAALKEPNPDFAALRRKLGITESGGKDYLDLRGFRPAEMILDAELSRIDFSHGDFTDKRFGRGRLKDCLFRQATFRGNLFCSTFINCDFEGANCRSTENTPGCEFNNCHFDETNFSNTDMFEVMFYQCRFHRTVLRRSFFGGCTFNACDFVDPTLKDTYVSGCTFVKPLQNLRWIDSKTREPGAHEMGANANWLDLTEQQVLELRVKAK
jgi:uncharacterized protein YjbI with pentapeptide repeats